MTRNLATIHLLISILYSLKRLVRRQNHAKKRAISEVCPLLYHNEGCSPFELVNSNNTHISQNRIIYNCCVIIGKLIFKLS